MQKSAPKFTFEAEIERLVPKNASKSEFWLFDLLNQTLYCKSAGNVVYL